MIFGRGATRRLSSYRRPVLVGAHLKGDDPVTRAAAVGADCVQLFLSNPQSWKPPQRLEGPAGVGP